MIEYVKLFLPKCKKEVKIEISTPKFFIEETTCDTIYLLDGENAFKDSNATYKRAIRIPKYISYMASITKQKMIAVAIHNAGSEIGRINEYSPFKITNPGKSKWEKQNLNDFKNFVNDFINVVIPYIEKRYPVNKNRYIYGSSLAAITAIYLGYKYDYFKAVGAFSPASFIFPEAFNKFIQKNIKPEVKLFLYVGKQESSDGSFDKNLYYSSSLELYKMAKNYNADVRLLVNEHGSHCEASWELALPDFLSFIYFDNIIYHV